MGYLDFSLNLLICLTAFLAGFGIASRSELNHYRKIERDKIKLKTLEATKGEYNGNKYYNPKTSEDKKV